MNRPDELTPHPRVFAIVPAAGRSRRMGRPKQLLEVGGRPMLAAVVDSLVAGGVMFVAVVTRTEIADAMRHSLLHNTLLVLNDDPSTEMIDSVRMGLDAWAGRTTLRADDGFLIVPGDQPGIPPPCVWACLNRFRADPDAVVVAGWQGRRGHPLIFPAALLEFVRSSRCQSGLRELPRAYPYRVRGVECDSPRCRRHRCCWW